VPAAASMVRSAQERRAITYNRKTVLDFVIRPHVEDGADGRRVRNDEVSPFQVLRQTLGRFRASESAGRRTDVAFGRRAHLEFTIAAAHRSRVGLRPSAQ